MAAVSDCLFKRNMRELKKKKERVGKDKRIGKEKDKQIKEDFTTDQE